MDLGQIKEEANALKHEVENVAVAHLKYYKLWTFRFVVRLFTSIFWTVFIAVMGLLVSIFMAIAAAFALSTYFDSLPLGFLVVGVAFAFIMVLVYVLARKRIDRMWLKRLSEIYFQE